MRWHRRTSCWAGGITRGNILLRWEWYWGIDRLHYLEDRLRKLGAGTGSAHGPLFEPPFQILGARLSGQARSDVAIEMFRSFRSPTPVSLSIV